MLGVGRDGPTASGWVASAEPSGIVLEAARAAEHRLAPGTDAERDAWALLAAVSGVGPVAFGALLRAFGCGAAIMDAARRRDGAALIMAAVHEEEDREGGAERGSAVSAAVAGRIADVATRAGEFLDRLRALGVRPVILDDAHYPAGLRA